MARSMFRARMHPSGRTAKAVELDRSYITPAGLPYLDQLVADRAAVGVEQLTSLRLSVLQRLGRMAQQRAAVPREIKLRLGDARSDRVNLRDFLADVVLHGGV
jgi:predicted RNA polymerase sigma factor